MDGWMEGWKNVRMDGLDGRKLRRKKLILTFSVSWTGEGKCDEGRMQGGIYFMDMCVSQGRRGGRENSMRVTVGGRV
jgi:hypothetical protein